MALTDTAVKTAKPGAKPLKKADGKGLYLLVTPAGGKLWRLKYRHDGKEKVMALGAYPEVSLVKARKGAEAARELLAAGTDPMAERKAGKLARRMAVETSFAAVAGQWWQQWSAARSPRHAEYVLRRLEADVYPAIGARPVAEIQAPELVAMVKGIAARGAIDIAKRSLQTTGQVFRYAIAHGLASRNPAADIKPADLLPSRRKTNYARLDAKELPELLRHIEVYPGAAVTRLAMKLMALTFVRTSELIGARWAEFDLDAARWDIPAERMKMKTPHIVPLSDQAVTVLRTLQVLTGSNELLFPGERDHAKPMSNNTILAALARMGYKGRMTGHGFDDKIISLYARGMTVREIQSHLQEMYGAEVSPSLISSVTDAVSEEVKVWQARPLDAIYPIVYLDCMHVKVREGAVRVKAVYLAIGINMNGEKEVLGLWLAQTEGAKFWLQVVTELRNRGVQDIFIACVDGLKGFPDAIEAVFPKAVVQLCIVHMVRHSLNYVSWKRRKDVAADLRHIYQAATAEEAELRLGEFEAKWDSDYLPIGQSWRRNWSRLTPFFDYPAEIRKVIYTTNAIESVNMGLRKLSKNRGSFPSDEALTKLFYLALRNISQKWTMPIRDCKTALTRFTIQFGDRISVN